VGMGERHEYERKPKERTAAHAEGFESQRFMVSIDERAILEDEAHTYDATSRIARHGVRTGLNL
jgi:predicted signal transduction protein with EAL and GGDEF domain